MDSPPRLPAVVGHFAPRNDNVGKACCDIGHPTACGRFLGRFSLYCCPIFNLDFHPGFGDPVILMDTYFSTLYNGYDAS